MTEKQLYSHDSIDYKEVIFEECISKDKMRKKTKEYQTFVLEDIFSEYELKELMNGIEKIVQKNSENKKPKFGKNTAWGKRDQFVKSLIKKLRKVLIVTDHDRSASLRQCSLS